MTQGLACVNHPASEAPAVRCASCLRAFCHDCVRRRGTFYYCTSCEPAVKIEAGAPLPQARFGVQTIFSAADSSRRAVSDEPVAMVDVAVAAASLASRVVASVVDVIILTVAVSFVLGVFRTRDETAQFMIASALALAYEAIFVQRMGKTPGKALLDIQVVAANGGAAGDVQAWARAVLKLGQLGCCCAPFVAALFSREHRAIHDQIAGTRVVRGSRRRVAA